jgi:hypothetical protein
MDKGIMKEHMNRRSDTALAVLILFVITAAAAAAIPLMVLTNSGTPK